MPKKTSTSESEGQRRKPKGNGQSRRGAKPEKPPESAENFEHVIRRLISGRSASRGSEGQR